MKMNKKLLIAACLLGVFTFAGIAASSIEWTWMEYDKPIVGHYMWRSGTAAYSPNYSKHFQVTQDIWNKMSVLPTFSEKKLPGVAHPAWTVASGDWAFSLPNQNKFVPTNEEYRAYWRDLANTPTGKQRMAIKELGEFPIGYPLALLIFTKTPDNKPLTEPEELHALGKPIVWLQGPIHGGEQDAGDGISWEAYSLAMGEWDHYLEKVSVILLPRINQDGAMMMTRGSNIRDDKVLWTIPSGNSAGSSIWNVNTNIDMNRDNLWFDMPSLRAVHTAFNAYFPEVAADHHQYSTSWSYFGGYVEDTSLPRIDGRPQLLVSRDAAGNPILSSSSGMTNMAPADPRQAQFGLGTGTSLQSTWDIALQHGDHLNNPRDFQTYWEDKMEPYVMKFLADRGVGSHHYIDGTIGCLNPERYGVYYTGLLDAGNNNIPDGTGIPSGGNEGAMFDPAHMFNALPLKPCLSALIESRSSGIQAYPKRVYSQYASGEAMIAFTAENAAEVKKFVADMRNKIAERGKVAYPNSTDPEDSVYNLMKMVQRTITSEDWIIPNGDKVTLPSAFWNTRNAEPQVYRVRPTAYILPYSKMNADVAKRLIFNGAAVEVLTQDTVVEVEDFGEAETMASKRYHDNARRIVIAPSESTMNSATIIKAPDFTPWSPPFWVQDKPNTLPVKTVTVPKDSFIVYMSQPTARMIASVMEPDAERSYTRWSIARKTYADLSLPVCVPYRYMKEERLLTKPLFMAWPQATGAGMMEIEPLSGAELDSLVATHFSGNKFEKVVVAQTMYAKVDSTMKMGFSFLSREELRKDMPDADFFFWNYTTGEYDNIKRNADGTVYVGEEYCGPHGDYGIQPIMFVAAITKDSLIDKVFGGSGCNAGFALFALLLIAPFMRRRG